MVVKGNAARRRGGTLPGSRFVASGIFLIVALILLGSGLLNLGPDWAAHTGHGNPGTFTAKYYQCNRGDCRWYGTFQPTDTLTVPRDDVGIVGGAHINGGWSQVPAVDTGDWSYVYAKGGGDQWEGSVAMVSVGAVVLLLWLWFVVARRLLRRRRGRVDGRT
ncbi:hypothetical protein [Streptacidiphilus sp. EB103A]|uniref:hypothetical protein n=1 Tax=Streptacidiphilus sp. EB103A TaxID=3156275 RepID=UPI003510FA92